MANPAFDVERRVRVWTALAELFVARELQDYDYRTMAAAPRESALTESDIEEVLRAEVAPAFMVNLNGLNPVPLMESWSEDEVREMVLASLANSQGLARRLLALLRADPLRHPVVQPRWQALRRLLNG